MKSEKIRRAIGGIDDELIEAADQPAFRAGAAPVRRFVRISAIAAAVLVLLVGSVYGISRWVHLRAADEFPASGSAEDDTDSPVPTYPAPQTVMEFEAGKGSTYVGFLLPDSYVENADPVSSATLEHVLRDRSVDGATLDSETLSKAYVHYRNKTDEPHILAIEVLDAGSTTYRSYFTRYDIQVEKEGEIAGMDGMWIYTKVFDLDTYNLFLKNETLGCIVVVSSTESFDAAEQAARDLTLVDSGAATVNADEDTAYAVRLTGTPPEGLEILDSAAMDKVLAGSKIADPTLDLTELYDSRTLSRPGQDDLLICMVLSSEPDFPVYLTEEEGYVMIAEEALAGGTARWYQRDSDSGSTALVIRYPDQAVNVVLEAFGAFRDEYRSDILWFVSHMELVGIPISKAAPAEFNILSAG